MSCPFNHAAGMPTIMEVLKTSTASLHDAAEGHQFQRSLVKGDLTREQFASYLAQLLLVHRALEAELRRHAPTTPAIARVIKPYQFQEPYLLEDLAFYGVDPSRAEPLPATSAIVEEVRRASGADPLSLLGYHYVLEGSNNGNVFIARALAKSFGLTGNEGLRYLNPYGDQQRPYWAAFKDDMNACGFSPVQMKTLATAAMSMFKAIGAISSEMAPAAVA